MRIRYQPFGGYNGKGYYECTDCGATWGKSNGYPPSSVREVEQAHRNRSVECPPRWRIGQRVVRKR